MISYASGAANGNLLLATLPSAPTVGQSVSFSSATVEDSRNYAIGVAVAQSKFNTLAVFILINTALISLIRAHRTQFKVFVYVEYPSNVELYLFVL